MFRRLFRLLFVSTVLFSALSVIVLTVYYTKSYLPQRDNILSVIQHSSYEEQNLSTPARKLLLNLIEDRSCLMPARSLIYKLDVEHPIGGMLGQHLSMLFWSVFVCQDFNEQQRLAIVASHWPYFSQLNAQGLTVAANYLYQQPLSELSIEQLAHVVACSRGEFVCIRESKRTDVAMKLLESYYKDNEL